MKCRFLFPVLYLALVVLAPAEVMLQWFETEWDEIYRRLPEVAEIGYDYMWLPSPCKGPTGLGTKWGNVGYNLYDRFDLGDVPQRGSLATRYGTRGDLRNMVDKAHQCDVKIIPDIIMNHNGNGPDFRSYPGMRPEDFHLQWEQGHANSLNYKRGPRMDQWGHGDGYGGTLWQELVSLIDIRTEDHPTNPDRGRFTGGNNTPGWNFVGGTSFLRHPGQYDRYPYYPDGYGPELASEMLFRWIAWLGDAMDYDGLRLDAGKHVEWEFFGTRGQGFLHEAQWNFNRRRGYSDGNPDEADELFANYFAERDDALIFAEILSHWGEIEYWYGYGSNDRNPMRFLDYAIKKTADSALNGNIGNFHGYGKDFGPNNGIMYVWGHDEGPASKVDLGYAYILSHIGFPMVYFTGSNITWDDHNTRTWMRPGYDSKALGDQGNDIANLVWLHQQFARGAERDLYHDGDYLALERYDDSAEENKGLLVVALNDSGWDMQKDLYTTFSEGTILHDYTGHFLEDWGHGPGNVRVDSGGKVTVKVPGNGGQGWVGFAPLIPEQMGIDILQGGSPAPTMSWIVPGGIHGDDKPRNITRITASNFTVNARYSPPAGASVDAVMMKWGRGTNLTANYFSTERDSVSGLYESMTHGSATNHSLDIAITENNIPEGLNVIKCRAFVQRSDKQPALFNTETKVVYVDRRGPEVAVSRPTAGTTVHGDAVMEILNPDFTAYEMTVSVNGGTAESATMVMRGKWRYALRGLATGMHTAVVTTTEADWGDPRTQINSSTVSHAFTVVSNTVPVGLSIAHGTTNKLPFFDISVDVGGQSPDGVRLYWDGYELPFNDGALTHTFNGEIIHGNDPANVATDRLWGAFCNGDHFFEAVRVDGAVTSRAVHRVVFNLYGIKAIDSDGDGLPDNVEMPFIDSQGAPGADAPWPGDSNRDFIPNYGEQWTRLNPYNHSTFYSGQWDDSQDFDGDGYSNGEEVRAGYAEGNIYKYDIYNGASFPSGTPTVPSVAVWAPTHPLRGQNLAITYSPNQGPLEGAAQVLIHIGHSLKTQGEWKDVISTNMAASGTDWTYNYTVPTNATSVEFVFHDGNGTWDNNDGDDWHVTVQTATNTWFVMDGAADSDDYVVFPDTMKILAAVKNESLYVATWAVGESGGNNDHFIYVTDELNEATAMPWGKQGMIFFDTGSKPFLAAEGENDWEGWINVNGVDQNEPGGVLEGEINLADAFGSVPDAVYIAAISYGTGADPLNSQGPHTWNSDNNIDTMEFLRVPIASIRDEDLDGHFDGGSPEMWTVVNNNTNDANYGLRRMFLNETAGDTRDITVVLEPDAGGTNTVSDVQLFSNLNRRDYAVLPGEEDWDAITPATNDGYYRVYPMTPLGGGRYAVTVTVRKCGAYRINARYRVNGGDFVYYTDNGLRRDCAVVVSPEKALDLVMYELNPMFAEATNAAYEGRSTFADMVTANLDRPDVINTNHFTSLGVNMIWLQPIHPIGSEGRQIDPGTGAPYEPGSPYAVRNYWQVNSVLGDPDSTEQAMTEFSNFVQRLDESGVGVMLDGTFNHSAWDCEVGEVGVDMFGWATNAQDLIRDVRPAWYSKKDSYGEVATHYFSAATHDVAVAPDRIDFGKWPDAADFHFGVYDTLVQEPATDTNNAWASPWHKRYLFEEDRFDGFVSDATRELWRYFARYPLYWLEKTGHPAGTAPTESHRGIDGLRCDFAQGLPSHFWEYCINRTRSVKWDFVFMAESLDGYVEVNGSKRHGVGYRSARHFDVLNENLVFYWRDNFFSYYDQGSATPETYPTWQALDNRRNAFDVSPILLNLTSHDEILPSDNAYRILYAHATLAALDGVPMLFYGQEAGLQNYADAYAGVPNGDHNFDKYEENFGKWIPNFKRYNSMSRVWENRDFNIQGLYGRVNRARLRSPALRSQMNYFLARTGTSDYDPDIFAVAKFEQPGVSAATQDVVFVFVNNDFKGSTNRWASYKLDADYQGANWFGIDPARRYNLVNLLSPTPTNYVWATNEFGADLIADGITVGLTGNPYAGEQAQYLKLVDTAVGPLYPDHDGDGEPDYSDPDDDNDGLPDDFEIANGLNPKDATGVNGGSGDKDGDGMSNLAEFRAGTDPDDPNSVLELTLERNGAAVEVGWDAVLETDYELQKTGSLVPAPPSWTRVRLGTALGSQQGATDGVGGDGSSAHYRVVVKP